MTLLEEAARVLAEIDDGLLDGSLIDGDTLGYLCDNVRPLVCKLLGHSPHCGDVATCRARGARSKTRAAKKKRVRIDGARVARSR